MNIQKNSFSTKVIAETVVFVALATVLSNIKIFSLPQGGSVTAASMVPILWLALRRGPKVGLFGALMYGLIQAVFDPFIVHPAQMLFDYPIAFGLLGIAGFFQKRPFIGVTLGIIGRFVAHYFSGIIFFAEFAEGNPLVYSAVYNGGYLIVELVISIYIIYMLKRSKVLEIYM
ncbi:MAG: energy-coupled thiamine transporter ThiT [Candidatus Bathyarchaeum tardum]|nr:MAG: energy-coupled thiamine transporter ThiT [Candidatus Bathyarchaeum tardum]